MAPFMIQHVNLTVGKDLSLAQEFYGGVLGLQNDPVPQLQKDSLLWFRLGDGPQQIHVSAREAPHTSSQHVCFSLPSPQDLLALQKKIYDHMVAGGSSAPMECDVPGGENSGSKGVEYPTRFFARDFAGNRLEFNVWDK